MSTQVPSGKKAVNARKRAAELQSRLAEIEGQLSELLPERTRITRELATLWVDLELPKRRASSSNGNGVHE